MQAAFQRTARATEQPRNLDFETITFKIQTALQRTPKATQTALQFRPQNDIVDKSNRLPRHNESDLNGLTTQTSKS